MITVGLVKELAWISSALKSDVSVTLFAGGGEPLYISVIREILEVQWRTHVIWKEKISGDTSFFGVESCDAISRIVACLESGNVAGANELIYLEA